MNENKLTFENVVNANWRKTLPYDAKGPAVSIEAGVLFTFESIWDEFKPASHEITEKDIVKLYNLMAKANKMYKLISKLESDEAKAIIAEIENDMEYPE